MGRIKWFYENVKQYVEVESNSECELLSEEYINIHKNLLFKCKCGNNFEATFANFLYHNKRQCNECGLKIRNNAEKISYSLVKQFIEIDSKSNCKLLTLEEDYIDTEHDILIKCSCGREFYTTFHKFKQSKNYSCQNCGRSKYNKRRKSTNEFLFEVYNECGWEYIVLDEYVNTHTKIKMKHECGYIYLVEPADFLSGRRCPKCAGKIAHKTTEYFKQEVYSLTNGEYEVLGEYKLAKENILMKHKECGFEWNTTPDLFLNQNIRCPKCTGYKSEIKSMDVFHKYNINYIRQYKINECRDKKPLPFDFAICMDDLILLETDGYQHFYPVNFGGISDERALENLRITQYHDEIKNKYCKDNGIRLIRIPYWDFDRIEEILKMELLVL